MFKSLIDLRDKQMLFFCLTVQNYNIKPPKDVAVKKKMQKKCIFLCFSLFFWIFQAFFL